MPVRLFAGLLTLLLVAQGVVSSTSAHSSPALPVGAMPGALTLGEDLDDDGDPDEVDIRLEIIEVQEEVYPGEFVSFWVFAPEGQGMTPVARAPSPTLRVEEGDRVRITLLNAHYFPHTIHPHGTIHPNEMDGVPDFTQPAVKPGEAFTYELTAKNPGTHWYHCHEQPDVHVVDGYPLPATGRAVRDTFTVGPAQRIDLDLRTGIDGYYASGPGVWLVHDHTEPTTTNKGISPGGDITAIVYDGFMDEDGLPKVATSLDRFNPMFISEFSGLGKRTETFVTPDEDVTLEFHCHVETHEKMGMLGRVIVGTGGRPAAAHAHETEERIHRGIGAIVSVDLRKSRLVIDHEEIPGFMAPMVMSYAVDPPTLLQDITADDQVRFTVDANKRAIVDIQLLP